MPDDILVAVEEALAAEGNVRATKLRHSAPEWLRVLAKEVRELREFRLEMVREAREASGLFAGALPITPEAAWFEMLERVRRLNAGQCGQCDRRESDLARAREALEEIASAPDTKAVTSSLAFGMREVARAFLAPKGSPK